MAFAGPQHYFTTRLIYKMCGTKQLFHKSSDSLLICCFFIFWIMQQINTSYCQNLPAEFPQASLLPKQIFPWGFPQICGFFFISFSNRKMTKDSGPVTNNHRICSRGQRHHASKFCDMSDCTAIHFTSTGLMQQPFLCSSPKAGPSPPAWVAGRATWDQEKAGCESHHPCPTELHLPCYPTTSFENHALCFETYLAKCFLGRCWPA